MQTQRNQQSFLFVPLFQQSQKRESTGGGVESETLAPMAETEAKAPVVIKTYFSH